ncbi:hypothetical protein CEW46_21520 [Bacillus cereus]|nr:hypothetical protein CEW46_21520 [Bacillus cereus]
MIEVRLESVKNVDYIYSVESQSNNSRYKVGVDKKDFRVLWCECAHHSFRKAYCKHMKLVDEHIKSDQGKADLIYQGSIKSLPTELKVLDSYDLVQLRKLLIMYTQWTKSDDTKGITNTKYASKIWIDHPTPIYLGDVTTPFRFNNYKEVGTLLDKIVNKEQYSIKYILELL